MTTTDFSAGKKPEVTKLNITLYFYMNSYKIVFLVGAVERAHCIVGYLDQQRNVSMLPSKPAESEAPQQVAGFGSSLDVCGVCVVGIWSAASPGLSQTDWTLGLGGAAHLWCRAIMAPRINQLSPHTHIKESASVRAAWTICSARTIFPFT